STLREARLISARMLSPAVRELTLDPGEGFTFVAGQWVNLRLPRAPGAEGEQIVRAYSIASPPRPDGTYDVAVTKVESGPMSTWLHAVEPGTPITQSHAQGFFTLDERALEAGRPLLMIATGTGISPLRSMLLALEATPPTVPIALLFGNRTEDDALYRDDFERLAAKWPRFVFAPVLSRAPSSWSGRRGHVQAHLVEMLGVLGGTNVDAYVCGLNRMVGDVRNLLRKEHGLERGRVHSERYD
ncbi:MAG: FAD-dependent oxidoreductase, partial [Polyangiales bacterium]